MLRRVYKVHGGRVEVRPRVKVPFNDVKCCLQIFCHPEVLCDIDNVDGAVCTGMEKQSVITDAERGIVAEPPTQGVSRNLWASQRRKILRAI